MNIEDIYAFVIVAQEKNISKAAEILHLSQPTLTVKIKKIETQLDTTLLDRKWNGVNLTKEGDLFFFHAISLLEGANSLSVNIHSIKNKYNKSTLLNHEEADLNEIFVGFSRPIGSAFFISLITEIKSEYPDTSWHFKTRLPEQIIDLIDLGSLHIGIIQQKVEHENLICVPLITDKFVLIGPKNDTQPLEDSLSNIDILHSKPFIFFSPNTPIRMLMETNIKQLIGALPNKIHVVNDLSVMFNLLANGFGYTLLPMSFISQSYEILHHAMHASYSGARINIKNSPYHIYKLEQLPPIRQIYMIYSTRFKFFKEIHRISKKVTQLLSDTE